MGSTTKTTGPWVLQNNQNLTGLVDRLNTLLPPGARLPVMECDTYDLPSTEMKPGYKYMSTSERVSIHPRFGPGSTPYLQIPIGLGIFVSTVPLEWNSKTYPALVDIRGDFITIRAPYLFKEVPDRVDLRLYTIIADSE